MDPRLRKPALAIVSLLLIFLPGCVVESVQPFYTDKDVVFDKDLLGTWKVADKEDSLMFRKASDDSYYVVSYEDGKAEVYRAYLFELMRIRYLDVTVSQDRESRPAGAGQSIAVHTLWKVVIDGDTLRIYGLDESKLKDSLKEHPLSWANPDFSGDVLFTGTTGDIQDFIRRSTQDLFEEEGGIWAREGH